MSIRIACVRWGGRVGELDPEFPLGHDANSPDGSEMQFIEAWKMGRIWKGFPSLQHVLWW